MYEEPYKWVEAVGNRRQYLDEQFKQGSPVVALAYEAGIRAADRQQGNAQTLRDLRPSCPGRDGTSGGPWKSCGSASWKWRMSRDSTVHPRM